MRNPVGAWRRRREESAARDLDVEKHRLIALIRVKEEEVASLKRAAAGRPEREKVEAVKRIKALRNAIAALESTWFGIVKAQAIDATAKSLDAARALDARTARTLRTLLDVKSPAEFQDRYDRLLAGRERYRAEMDDFEITIAERPAAAPVLTKEERADLADVRYLEGKAARAAEREVDERVAPRLDAEDRAILSEIDAAAERRKEERR